MNYKTIANEFGNLARWKLKAVLQVFNKSK